MEFGENSGLFDVTVINDDVDDAYEELKAFVFE